MAKTAVKTSASERGSERDLLCAELRWDSQADALKGLFGAVWGGHRITGREYFAWQFLEGPKGRPIAHCARPDDAAAGALAGVYLVTPATLLAGPHTLEFSTSVYTATHPDYQRRGIFGRLAELTYDKCRREGIAGTVGVPNNNSLPGFRRLGFTVLGSMEVLARAVSPFGAGEIDARVREFESLRDFDRIVCRLDRARALSGTVLFERQPEFLAWRYFRCPGVRYRIFGFMGEPGRLTGLIVMRRARRKGVPITVIADFLVDWTVADADAAACALLSRAHLFALQNLTLGVITLVNPFSHEAQALEKNGFRRVSKRLLPHDCNLILKMHIDQPAPLASRLADFRNWHFSFGDYDIF